MRRTLLGCWTLLLASCTSPGPTADATRLLADLRARVETRKTATSRGDSTAWLAAADLHPAATCVDAVGNKRMCRPDFANPTQWQQHSVMDSVELELIENVAILTYRQIDTIVVGGNTAVSLARYVETYHLQAGRWQLLALTEAAIPGPRAAVPMSATALQQLVGTYGTDAYALQVTRMGGTLLIAAKGESPDTLWAQSPSTFFAKGDPGTYTFVLAEAGLPTALHYTTGSILYRFPRHPFSTVP